MPEVSIHPEAEEDYEAALGWYLDRSVRAANRFEAAFQRALDSIQSDPELHPRYDELYRFCPLRRYPYLVIYRVDVDEVRVMAVAHARRRPGYWRRRS